MAARRGPRRNDNDVRPFYYFSSPRRPEGPNRVYWSSTPGSTTRTTAARTVGHGYAGHPMSTITRCGIDPNDASHSSWGDDAASSQTWDKGGNYDFVNVITLAQPYIVSYDMGVPLSRVRWAAGQRLLVRAQPPSPGRRDQRRLDHHRRRRRLLHRPGPDRPEHRLLGVPGRQHGAPEPRHGRAHLAPETQFGVRATRCSETRSSSSVPTRPSRPRRRARSGLAICGGASSPTRPRPICAGTGTPRSSSHPLADDVLRRLEQR